MSIKVASPVASSDAGMDHIRTLIDEEQLMKQLDQDRRQNQPESLETVPPSTGKSIPVMNLLSSEARNTAADASSSAVPSRPIGIIFLK